MRFVVLLIAISLARTAFADDERARALFDEGKALLAAERWAEALERFDAAWALHPRASLLVNRAHALAHLGRTAEAANAYADYLAHPDATVENVPRVRAALARLDAQLGRLEIGVSEPGAIVVVDGHELGPAPQQLVTRVAPGRHEVSARKGGYTPAQALVTVAAGERRSLVLDVVLPDPVPVPVPDPDPDPVPVPDPDPVPVPPRVTRTSRLAAGVRLELDVVGFPGGAAVPGLAVTLGPVELGAAAILGPTFGAEASLVVRRGPLWLGAAIPVYATDAGALVGLSARAGLRLRLGPRLALDAGLGAQLHLSPPPGVVAWLLLPSVGFQVRI